MISSLGEGLNILISCDYTTGHNWMSYLCWYSIRNNLPDAKVIIISKRKQITGDLFLWTKKFNIPFRTYNEAKLDSVINICEKPLLIVPPDCVAVRDFEEAGVNPNNLKEVSFLENTDFVGRAKGNDFCVFASYSDGWGFFVTSEWINRVDCPLASLTTKNFLKNNMSLNEKHVQSIWSASIPLFQTASGGK
jgi:hypothetical protein